MIYTLHLKTLLQTEDQFVRNWEDLVTKAQIYLSLCTNRAFQISSSHFQNPESQQTFTNPNPIANPIANSIPYSISNSIFFLHQTHSIFSKHFLSYQVEINNTRI